MCGVLRPRRCTPAPPRTAGRMLVGSAHRGQSVRAVGTVGGRRLRAGRIANAEVLTWQAGVRGQVARGPCGRRRWSARRRLGEWRSRRSGWGTRWIGRGWLGCLDVLLVSSHGSHRAHGNIAYSPARLERDRACGERCDHCVGRCNACRSSAGRRARSSNVPEHSRINGRGSDSEHVTVAHSMVERYPLMTSGWSCTKCAAGAPARSLRPMR